MATPMLIGCVCSVQPATVDTFGTRCFNCSGVLFFASRLGALLHQRCDLFSPMCCLPLCAHASVRCVSSRRCHPPGWPPRGSDRLRARDQTRQWRIYLFGIRGASVAAAEAGRLRWGGGGTMRRAGSSKSLLPPSLAGGSCVFCVRCRVRVRSRTVCEPFVLTAPSPPPPTVN